MWIFLIRTLFLRKTVTWRSQTGIFGKPWAFGEEGGRGREGVVIEYLAAKKGAVTSCVINRGHLSDVSNLSE